MMYEFLPPLRDNALIDLVYPFAPHSRFMVSDAGVRTQQAFLDDVVALAATLPKQAYAINLCEDRYAFLVSFCALLLNNTINLLPPNRQANTLLDVIADYPDLYCLSDRTADAPACTANLPQVGVLDALAQLSPLTTASVPKIPAQQVAALAFTSGSTGKPKPNPKPFGTLAGLARFLGAALLKDTAPVMVATVPSQHMYGLETTIFMALQTPAVLHNQKPFFPADIQALLTQLDEPALLITTPTHLRALTQAELTMPNALALLSATAPLPRDLAVTAEAVFHCNLYEIYGCTEAGSMALRHSSATEAWQLLEGFRFTQNDEGTTADAPHLPLAAPLSDVIELLVDGSFLLKGRNADMINVAGKRASLAHLTQCLLGVDGVEDAVIFMPEGETRKEQRPVALVVSARAERDLLADLAPLMDAAFLPRPLKKVTRLPRNETGKLTRQSLLTLWESVDASVV